MKKQNLLSDFDSLLGPPIEDEIPKGFFSLTEIAEHRKISPSNADKVLKKLSSANKVERRQFRNSNGRVCWFYRVNP